MANVAPDRKTFETSEADFDKVAELVSRHAEDQIRIAGMLYGLNRSYTVREISDKLKERGVATFSYSWIARLVKVWGHWVVRCGYEPGQLVNLSTTKLYLAASHGVEDLDFVKANLDLTDAEFSALLRKEVGRPIDGKVISIPPSLVQLVDHTIERLGMYGHRATFLAVLEYAMEVINTMPDETLIRTWLLVHGEVPVGYESEQETSGAARALN